MREGAKYHVMARDNKGEKIFESNVIKEMFLDVAGRAKSKFKFQVYNFCIMGNHVHFIMRPAEKESLSRIMQWILSVFAVKYNKTFEFKGHVWYDRFKSVLIGNLIQFLRLLSVMENPVKAGLVKDAPDYGYNGVSFFSDGKLGLFAPP